MGRRLLTGASARGARPSPLLNRLRRLPALQHPPSGGMPARSYLDGFPLRLLPFLAKTPHVGPGEPGEGKEGVPRLAGALRPRDRAAWPAEDVPLKAPPPAAGADQDGRFLARFAEPGGRGGSRASETLPGQERRREQRGRNRLGDSAGSGDLGPARPRGQVSLSLGRQAGREEGGRKRRERRRPGSAKHAGGELENPMNPPCSETVYLVEGMGPSFSKGDTHQVALEDLGGGGAVQRGTSSGPKVWMGTIRRVTRY